MSTGRRGDYGDAIMQKRGFCLDPPSGAEHRLKQRINKGVPAGDGWLGRQGGSARSGDRSDETRGAALPPGARLNLAINIPGLISQFFGSRKRVVSVTPARACRPPDNQHRFCARTRDGHFSRSLEGNLNARDFGNIPNPSGVW